MLKNLGILLILLAVLLLAANWYIERRRKQIGIEKPQRQARGRRGQAPPPMPDFVHPRPEVESFHVHENEARVAFNVPFPADGDEVLADLLVGEAIEVVREKRHSLPIDDVTQVVALAGKGEKREVGRKSLETPGILPPPSRMTEMLQLHSIGADPLAAEFETGPPVIPETVEPSTSDELAPLSDQIRLPKAVDTGLRAQGVDPEDMTAGEMVTGILALFGYTVTPGVAPGIYTATRAGQSTFVMVDPYEPGDYPQVEDRTIRSFVLSFEQSGQDRGMLVSEKFAPFSIYDRERRDPRIRFVTRERLQKFVDSMSLA
ncbi:MAG: hypothetical protein WB239_08820 [Acidimicrobiia bacterium]